MRQPDSASSVVLKTPPRDEAPKLREDARMSVAPICLYFSFCTDSLSWKSGKYVGGNMMKICQSQQQKSLYYCVHVNSSSWSRSCQTFVYSINHNQKQVLKIKQGMKCVKKKNFNEFKSAFST